MKIIRLKIDKDVKRYLKLEGRKFGIDDPGFVEDIFALIRLRGNGLPSKERIAKMAKAAAKRRKGIVTEIGVTLLITKRKMMFAQVMGLPYFHALVALNDPLQAVVRFITKMRVLYNKGRESQCSSCSLMPKCDFGRQYGESVRDITKVIDPDFDKKAHNDCPHKPEISGINMLYSSIVNMQQMVSSSQGVEKNLQPAGGASLEELEEQAEEIMGFAPREDNQSTDLDPDSEGTEFHIPGEGTGGGSGVYDGLHNGDALCKVSENLIDQVTKEQLAMFELGRKFSTEITAQKKGKFKPVEVTEAEKRQEKIESIGDVAKILPSQHALPEAVFDARLEKRSLIKQKFVKPEHKKKLLYLLIDNSASMTGFLGGGSSLGGRTNNSSLYTKGALATLFSLAIIRRVRDDKGKCFVRSFTGAVSPLLSAVKEDEFEPMLDWVSQLSYKSGSTNIPGVIRTAVADITEVKADLAESEILLISDNEDSFTDTDLKALLGKTELNVLDVSGGSVMNTASVCLKKIANKYFKANEKSVNLAQIVSLL